jgi:probable blue pigment (indigoidine) exporter
MAAAMKVERIKRSKVIGVGGGVGGVALLSLHQALAPQSPRAAAGCVAVLLGAACVAFVYVVMKVRASRLHPTTVITWQMMAGAVPLAAAGLLIEGNPLRMRWTPVTLTAMVYLAMAGSVAAFWLNYWLLRRLPASAILLMGIVEAPLAALLGTVVLHERFDASMLLGTVLVVGGTALAIARPHPTGDGA